MNCDHKKATDSGCLEKLRRLGVLWSRSGFRHLRTRKLCPPYYIAANGRRSIVHAEPGPGSATCYRELVVDDCYGMFSLPLEFTPRVVVDIGANVGVFSKLVSVLYASACIHAFEPNPAAFQWLVRNADGTNIIPVQKAVSLSGGPAQFSLGEDSTLGSISEGGEVTVETIRPADIVTGEGIDLLKIDCEGGEWDIFQGGELLARTRRLCMEFHLIENHSLAELLALLTDAGHEVLACDLGGSGKTGHIITSQRT